MSALASLYNVPLSDEERAQWAFAHMAHHRDINRVIYQLVKVSLPEYALDPINPDDPGDWEYQHQIMHDNQNSLLGIKGNDLSQVDWKNQNLLAGWIWLQGNEHYQAAAILEIG
jgi:hypothetical protein